MRNFKDLIEKQGDTAIFCIGRFNPPTTGHLKMIEAAAAQKSKYAGAPFYVFPTHSQDPAKNPLPHALKVAYMKKMFKKYAKNIQVSKARNVFEMAVILHDKGHRAIVLVAGSDRVDEFDKLLNQYNGVEGRHGYYGFDSIEVVSAGERDPDAEGVEGMSASKMRAAAATGDFDNFKLGLPSGFKDDKKLFRDVRKNMGIREERDMGNMDDYETLRDAYLTGKIWNIDDLVESNGIEGRIVNKGTNYLAYMDGSGKVHKAWLHDIALNERNYKKEYDNYHSRPEQVANRSSRNKARRVMGDKVVKGMDVGHADNDPMNNDPKNLRNEDPSVNRREPRLREKDDLDEMSWFMKAKAKIDQMSHPKAYEAMMKKFVSAMKNPPKQKTPAGIAAEIAREYSVPSRGLIQYINKLVDKGVLPKELKAEVQTEMHTFKDLVNQINEVKQDKDIKDRKGTQPSKYYAKDTEGDEMAPSTKTKRAAHFAKKKAGPAPGDKSATTKASTHTKKFKQMYGEQKMECPPATKDLAINTKNRDATTKKYNYGPLNVDEPGDYWEKIAKHWKTTEEAAKKSLCENCVAFDVSPRMKECLPGATSDDDGELGYCWMHHFKCHSARACHTWAKGGPIDKDKESHNWQERAFGKKEVLSKDADQGDYIDDFQKSDAPQFKGKSKEKRKDMAIAAYLSKNESFLDNINKMLKEDGHTDVASMKNRVEIAMKALEKMQSELGKLGDEASLPTWWTNKVSTAVSRLDDMSDYIDTKVEDFTHYPGQVDPKKDQSDSDWVKGDPPEPIEFDGSDTKSILDKTNKKVEKERKVKVKPFVEMYQLDEKIAGLVKKSKKSGMPYGILKKVYDRGMAAWKTGHRPGTTPQQWAFARVNSFTTKSSGTWGKADADLAKQVRGESIEEDGPCWDTHKQVGMKTKNGKQVPNCVPKNEDLNEWGELEEASEYQGKKVTLNKPFYTPDGPKKSSVYVNNEKGNVVKVNFGDPNMEIKVDDPARRKSFRARHGCDNPGPKWKAKYWSCKAW